LALKYPGRKSSSPPKDLTDSFNEKYGYNCTYYNFVHGVAERYKGEFPIVIIENEITARDFWSRTMEEYLKLLITAKKVLINVDSQIKVADSGLASLCWGILMIDEMVKEGKRKKHSISISHISAKHMERKSIVKLSGTILRKQNIFYQD